ncbi:MAG TPA: hypothetical protein VLF20_04660 [Patescibacteria group bacterium]|nr:hypothetical protein [Patescibacteria group bacterium]
MIDAVQLILLIVIITLTLLLVILGIQVFFILKDVRQTVKKTNKILDNTEGITQGIEGPISAISSFFLGSKAASLVSVVRVIKTLLGGEREEKRTRE